MRERTDLLRDLAAVTGESHRTGVPVDEILERRVDRREFLRRSALAGAGVAGASALLSASASAGARTRRAGARPAQGDPRIVIVGAGLAGTTAAYRLWQAGYRSTLYEGDDRIGGRTETIRGVFDHGDDVEACGREINSNHVFMRNLVAELGLTMDNLDKPYPGHLRELVYVNGAEYTPRQLRADFAEVYPALHRDTLAAPWPTTYRSHTPAAVALDHMTLAEWIERNVPGGRASNFGTFLETAYVGEWGLDAEDQSALNVMYEAGDSTKKHMLIYGHQDWKWHVRGGNDLVVATMAERLPTGTVQMGARLVAITMKSDGTYRLTFDREDGTKDVAADRVILALPFTTLRNVDYSKAGFDALKDRAIQNLGMATNARLYLQFDTRPWQAAGLTGDATTDLPFQATEMIYPTRDGAGGIIDMYTGGTKGASYRVEEDGEVTPKGIVRTTLTQLEQIYPGATKAYNGKSWIHVPAVDEWFLGSYSCPRPGEYTSIYGSGKLPQGGVHFAGEHTSVDWIGFMNGGVETGERAAREVKRALRGA